jgi:rare lipoprotein A (peptidoglycan hydrolase)
MMRARVHIWVACAVSLGLAACSTTPEPVIEAPPQFAALPPAPVPETPRVVFNEIGTASWYGRSHHGRKTASGERYDMNAMTAAHRTLPFNTRARVTNLDTGKSVDVLITDRGPYKRGRIIDLSSRAAQALGMHADGVAPVRVEVFEGNLAEAPPPKVDSPKAATPKTATR